MNTRKVFFALLLPLLFFSCTSTRKTVYFQGIDTTDMSRMAVQYEVKIQSGDNLYITVASTRPEAVEVYNKLNAAYSGSANMQAMNMLGYIVDESGDINFPGLGKVRVSGLTRAGASDLIQQKISVYVNDATVNVRFVNFRVTVLGEVNRPGTFTVENENITLPEALGLAGDMTIYGMRNNVLVYRETNGVKSYHRMDMTSPEIFGSEYFYLHQNDIVYVQPNKARSGSAAYNQNLPLGVSVLSLLVTVLMLFVR